MLGTAAVSLIAIGILGLILLNAKESLVDQNIADRWSEKNDFAHNTLYFSTRAKVDKKQIEHLESEVIKGFEKMSVMVSFDSEDGVPANLLDCYAAFDTLTLSSDIRKESTFDAIGVGGDFFRFHPLQMDNGCYFDDDNIMSDYVILDEEAAWALFGSMDVSGMKVHMGDKDLYVAGVYKRGQSDVENLAYGNTDPKVYVNYGTMAENNEDVAITVYELLAPNPIPHAAYRVLNEIKIFDTDTYKILENSNRFSYAHYFDLLKEKKAREMRTDDIGFPYWENVARYKEGKMMRVAHAQWIIAGILTIMVLINVIWFLVDHKPTKKDFEKVVDSVREKGRKKRYEEQRQKLIEEEFGPEPVVEELPAKAAEVNNSTAGDGTNSENGTGEAAPQGETEEEFEEVPEEEYEEVPEEEYEEVPEEEYEEVLDEEYEEVLEEEFLEEYEEDFPEAFEEDMPSEESIISSTRVQLNESENNEDSVDLRLKEIKTEEGSNEE